MLCTCKRRSRVRAEPLNVARLTWPFFLNTRKTEFGAPPGPLGPLPLGGCGQFEDHMLLIKTAEFKASKHACVLTSRDGPLLAIPFI